jgi:hypothetical protein
MLLVFVLARNRRIETERPSEPLPNGEHPKVAE